MRPSRSGVAAYRLVQQTLHRTEPVRAQAGKVTRITFWSPILRTYNAGMKLSRQLVANLGTMCAVSISCYRCVCQTWHSLHRPGFDLETRHATASGGGECKSDCGQQSLRGRTMHVPERFQQQSSTTTLSQSVTITHMNAGDAIHIHNGGDKCTRVHSTRHLNSLRHRYNNLVSMTKTSRVSGQILARTIIVTLCCKHQYCGFQGVSPFCSLT